ncbi:hypothetical protein SLA2020_285140 [Shorea laevis]
MPRRSPSHTGKRSLSLSWLLDEWGYFAVKGWLGLCTRLRAGRWAWEIRSVGLMTWNGRFWTWATGCRAGGGQLVGLGDLGGGFGDAGWGFWAWARVVESVLYCSSRVL